MTARLHLWLVAFLLGAFTLPALAIDVVAMYRRIYPGVRNDELLYMAGTDRGYFYDSTVQAALKSEQGGAPAYHYQFYRETPVEGGRYHVPHASEIPFIFDTLDKAVSIGATRYQQVAPATCRIILERAMLRVGC